MAYPRPLCNHPIVIFNRNAIYNLTTIGEYYIGGKRFCITPEMRLKMRYDFPFKKFSRYSHGAYYYDNNLFHDDAHRHVNWEYLESSYCGFDRHGQKCYLFLAVACGHCELCTEKKQNDFIARVGFESQTSSSRPMMVTLTYDPKHLPFVKRVPKYAFIRKNNFDDYNFDNVSTEYVDILARGIPYKKLANKYIVTHPHYQGFQPCVLTTDVQKFLKRLRINWSRSGLSLDKPPLRYVCFAEYGHNYGRPHYHFIFWNVPYDIHDEKDFTMIESLKQDILTAWGMCHPDSCQCEVARDAAKYVGKYISKNLTFSDGRKTFRLASNRHGGIGAAFLDSQKDFLRKYPSVQRIEYVNKWNGELVHSTLGSYAMNRVFPTASAQIPDKYKQSLRYASTILSRLSRVASAFRQTEIVQRCETCIQSLNLFPSILPIGITPYVEFDPLSAQILKAPMFTDFIEYYDNSCFILSNIIDDIESVPLPSERDVLDLDKKRHLHNSLFARPDVTDSLCQSLTRSIRQKRKISEASEIF